MQIAIDEARTIRQLVLTEKNTDRFVVVKAAGFIEGMAQVMGVPIETVRVAYRELRTSGLLTSGARGVNAPDMVPLDATRMLIWGLVSDRPVDAVEAVKDFGNLVFEESVSVTEPDHTFRFDGGHFDGAHTFEQALTQLIVFFIEDGRRRKSVGNCYVDVNITGLSAQIVINDREHDYSYPTTFPDMTDDDDPIDLPNLAGFIESENVRYEKQLRHAKKIYQYRSINFIHFEETARLFREVKA
jgi:hypothetical protein